MFIFFICQKKVTTFFPFTAVKKMAKKACSVKGGVDLYDVTSC